MPTWNEINIEIDQLTSADAADRVRHKYLNDFGQLTGRPVIYYYSGFLTKRKPDGSFHEQCAINDNDMNGMMAVVHGLNRTNGLDLVIQTPGGGIEAARSIVEYLYLMFGKNLRVFVPHMSMSAGTMIACASNRIFLTKHSCLGPTDPQIRGLPALGVLAEVDRAIVEIKKEPLKQIVWQQVFSKYPPAFILDCERQVEGARQMVKSWLAGNMFSDEAEPENCAEKVVSELMNYEGTSEHGQHFLYEKCRSIGLKVELIEGDQSLQESLLSVHHSYMASFARGTEIKYIENSSGSSWSVST